MQKESALCVSLLEDLFRGSPCPGIAVRLWDGTVWAPHAGPDAPPLSTFVIRHPAALKRMLLPPSETRLGEAFIFGDVDIEGDIFTVFPLVDYFFGRKWKIREIIGLLRKLWKLPSAAGLGNNRTGALFSGAPHSKERDRKAVRYHYDVSNRFFSLFLDRLMTYSCAYFTAPDDDIDSAQDNKLDYICRKLRLKPGERFLDIGCGWGSLVMHAAEKYGAEAFGITLSRPQAEFASEAIKHAGLDGKCRVDVMDYRDVEHPEGFHKIASVGMFEHVGESRLNLYFRKAWRLLKAGGAFLNHGIGFGARTRPTFGKTFSDSYVFPDGELLHLDRTLRAAEGAGFEIRDVEGLREHYARTLRLWVARLEKNRVQAIQAVGEELYRIWRLYMSGSAYGFEAGYLNVYQCLLVKAEDGRCPLPPTRTDLYAPYPADKLR